MTVRFTRESSVVRDRKPCSRERARRFGGIGRVIVSRLSSNFRIHTRTRSACQCSPADIVGFRFECFFGRPLNGNNFYFFFFELVESIRRSTRVRFQRKCRRYTAYMYGMTSRLVYFQREINGGIAAFSVPPILFRRVRCFSNAFLRRNTMGGFFFDTSNGYVPT